MRGWVWAHSCIFVFHSISIVGQIDVLCWHAYWCSLRVPLWWSQGSDVASVFNISFISLSMELEKCHQVTQHTTAEVPCLQIQACPSDDKVCIKDTISNGKCVSEKVTRPLYPFQLCPQPCWYDMLAISRKDEGKMWNVGNVERMKENVECNGWRS